MYFILKTETFAKLFFLISCTGLLLYATLAFYTFHTAYSSMSQFQKYGDDIPGVPITEYKVKLNKRQRDLKYVLMWTTFDGKNTIGEGQAPFVDRNCLYTNCYLTTDKYLLNENYTNFDAIIFDIEVLKTWKKKYLPYSRLNQQKYIFHSKISSDDAPVCSVFADNYFNWTWSYRLDSDIFSPFIEVKDLEGNAVAPKHAVKWESNMTLLADSDKKYLKRKKKAMAWISTKCETRNDRMVLARRLQRMFRENSLVFDIFGCSQQECPKEGCLKAIERDYYFYYAPEDSNAKDYVTREVMVGFNHHAVPVVNGGADYARFIPEGSYINAGAMSRDKLVALVEYIIRNTKIYYSFHRWRKHYVINEADTSKGICEICEYLNDKNRFDTISVRKGFRKWWNSHPLFERCFPKGAESLSEVLSYVNSSRRYSNW